ncbi:MAG: phenylacetate--CoA ligase family protein [candidate division Zixibacteria bacterium]|nr:phenylacetate--CoA ligase family protein [candidate division Zixibacteria bacterium]
MNSSIEKLYNNSPVFFQNIGISLYGLKIYLREYGKKLQIELDKLDKSQWYSINELKEYQSEKLRKLIKHSYNHVPYYRNIMDSRRLKPDDIKTIKDLYKLPVLTKNDIKHNLNELTANNYKPSQLIKGHTSGTTGTPLQFYYDKHACLVKNAVDWRQKNEGEIDIGDKIALFLGRVAVPITQGKPPYWRTNWILNHRFYSSFHLSSNNIDKYIDDLERFQPAAFEGYPSTAYIIARFLLSKNKSLPLKAVFTSSETLFPQQREVIEKAFKCPLYDFYGMAERVIFATECSAHEGHHLNMDYGITEILNKDNEPASDSEMGRIIATGLHNYAMPLIRYQTSDVTALKKNECSCGREFPLMEDVTTKAEDVITTKDGRLISSSILTHPFKPMRYVAESQIIQEDLEHIRIKIVKLPGYKDDDTKYLLNEFIKRVGDDMKIDIEFVESIPRTKMGKFRWVISKVPLGF